MTGKHILVVGHPSIGYVSSALNMIKDIHGTTQVRYTDEMPNDTQMPMPEATVKVESCGSIYDDYIEPIRQWVEPARVPRVTGLQGNSDYTPSQLEALKRKQERKRKKEGR